MKIFILLTLSFFLSNCVSQSAADKLQNISFAQTPIVNQTVDANANKYVPANNQTFFDAKANKVVQVQEAKPDIDETQHKELEARNAEFKIVPDEWKQIDFENFTYPTSRMKGFIHLKNGEFEYSNRKEFDNHFGSSGNRFYVDLVGDATKEAIVSVFDASCGGSCDGGSEIIYFYSLQKKLPKLLGRIETGSTAYGCSIKSFKVKNKEITLEQFGHCQKKSNKDEGESYMCKFCVKDLTVSTYVFEDKKLIKKSSAIISAPTVDVKNYTGTIYSIE